MFERGQSQELGVPLMLNVFVHIWGFVHVLNTVYRLNRSQVTKIAKLDRGCNAPL